MGIRAFILSGYPHLEACDLFAKYVLPHLPNVKLNELQQRLIQNPVTPLTSGPRY
jgi:alkanesulfonate monooxygenase